MHRRSLVFLAAAFGLMTAAAPCAPGQKPLEWRFWGVADGLTESNTAWLTVDGKGVAWAKHGGTTLTRLDGQSVSFIPDPYEGGRLAASADGDLWQLKGRDLRRYDGHQWHAYEVPAFEDLAPLAGKTQKPGHPPDTNAFVPLGRGRVLILFAHKIIEFNPTGAATIIANADPHGLKSFLSVREGLAGAIWITGENGVARYTELPQGAGAQWRQFIAPPALTDFTEPREGDRGELFAAASRAGKPVLVRLDQTNWEVIYTGDRDPLRAWRGGEGDLWIADGNQIMRLNGDKREAVEKSEAFSGIVQNTLAGEQGAFWITTSQGIARHAPPLWRVDAEIRGDEGDELVGSSCEGADGAVWFLTSRYLMKFDGGAWKKFPLPPGFKRVAVTTEALNTLRDGSLAIANSTSDIFIFHPGPDTFETLHHPEGRIVRMFGLRHDGNLFVQTLNPTEREDFSVEIFDGREFHPWLDLGRTWGFWDLRTICETTGGDIWFGAVNGLGILHNGKYRKVASEEVTKDGAFTVFERSPGRILVGGRKDLREFDGSTWTILRGLMDRARKISRAPDGTLWVASGTGIHRLRNGVWISNGVEEGLPSSVAYNVLADSHGRVWAGTTQGLSRYHPEADAAPPHTLIDEGLNAHTIAPGAAVHIVFSGIDKWKTTEAGRLLFSTRIDGGAWGPFDSTNTATFSGLKSGPHHFEARAMDRNGNIDLSPAHFDFSVLVPWYRQTAFLGLAAAALLAIFLLLRSALMRHRKIKFDSQHDPLTRLLNRRAFEVALQNEIGAAREASSVAVFLIDLDKFKPVNDTLGHAAGDAFLREVARRLESCSREAGSPGAHPTLARIGGDEFAVVLPRTTRAATAQFATAMIDCLRQPCRIVNREFKTTASIGISLFPEHAQDVAGLQRLADLAMYDSKSQSGDSFRIFEPQMNTAEVGNARMAGLIRDGLNHGYFSVNYQPIVRPTGEYYAVEALLRLNHPEAGRIPPLDFIPVAEETGLIEALGMWVLAEACRQMALWRSGGQKGLRVSINVSPLQLANPGFVELVIDVITQAGLDPEGLILEITETAMMSRSDAARAQLEQLRRIGIKVALDDFGTGYSSLSSLHLLPIDIVKIDRSFTQRLGEDTKGGAMLDGIILMAHQLAFEVVAEGVETEDQREWLRLSQCELLQGYLHGRPVPAEDALMQLESACAVFV